MTHLWTLTSPMEQLTLLIGLNSDDLLWGSWTNAVAATDRLAGSPHFYSN
jgi:hypothetical protein